MSLNIPIVDDVLPDPQPHEPPAGDWHDDDGQALASYFLHNDPIAIMQRMIKAAVTELAPPVGTMQAPEGNRLILRNYVLTAAQPAIYALPPDPNRLHVKILDVSNAGFYFADTMFTPVDDAGTASHQTPAMFVGSSSGSGNTAAITLDDYTGPLYIASKFATGAVIELVAITA